MCLLNFSWQPEQARSFVLVANRDEFYHRKTLPLYRWQGSPAIYAGQDLEAEGTWLGITQTGRFAALTNVRGLPVAYEKSRGELVSHFLKEQTSPLNYLNKVRDVADQYNGFNLLVGDFHPQRKSLAYISNRNDLEPKLLTPGTYGLSNASLDTPWPKLIATKRHFQTLLSQEEVSITAWLHALDDTQLVDDALLPNTGMSLEWERLLSAAFIRSPDYGTRSQSFLKVTSNHILFHERTYSEHALPPLFSTEFQFKIDITA